MEFAIVSAAPVFSRIVPMMVPHRMTIPMLVMMLPKPLFTVLTTFSGVSSDSGYMKPQSRPTISAISVMTMNGCIFSLEMATIISTTDRMISAKSRNVCMLFPPLII